MSSEGLSQLWQAYRNSLVSNSLNGYDSYYPEKTVRILDACCASEILRNLFPYISIGRLGIWRVHPDEAGPMKLAIPTSFGASMEVKMLMLFQIMLTPKSYFLTRQKPL